MANPGSAKEWLVKAWHDLSSARILLDAGHYTDTIAVDLQQAIEKCFKAIWAYENKPIKKTHNLIEIYEWVSDFIQLEESQVRNLGFVSAYYLSDRYPTGHSELPSHEQISEILQMAQGIFIAVCDRLAINPDEVMR